MRATWRRRKKKKRETTKRRERRRRAQREAEWMLQRTSAPRQVALT